GAGAVPPGDQSARRVRCRWRASRFHEERRVRRGRRRDGGVGGPPLLGDAVPAGEPGRAPRDPDREALARRLRTVEVFSDLADDERHWLAEHATVVELEAGEALFRRGDPADIMFSVLDGEVRSRREDGVSDGRLYVRRTGQTGGVLPHSRITVSPLTCRAVLRSTVACFTRSDFPAMVERIPGLEQRLA